MAGGSPTHAALSSTTTALVRAQLPRGCRIYGSDLRVRVASADAAVYPDGALYRQLPSVNEVLLVSQAARCLEVHRRTPAGWEVEHAEARGRVALRSIGGHLDVDQIYADLT